MHETNQPYSVTEDEQNVRNLVNEVVSDLHLHIEDCSFDVNTCDELICLLTSPHVQGLVESMEEIARGNFHQPASLSDEQNHDEILYAFPPSMSSKIELSMSDPRVNTLQATSTLNAGRNGTGTGSSGNLGKTAILTGGGEGLPMKPVDGNLKIVSFVRTIGEDLVRYMHTNSVIDTQIMISMNKTALKCS